ncbi:hypothetical protein GHT06_018365 [Daphnia sinensis]|uniref:Nicotinamide riboside kinase 1 n=1 Tax=Daphnia sinensis TaxID=1820382 RepID=A0AAD5L516_9CRUS|nr:hypothetical protein GHT06_018365 [Daphnia sinensis]
MISLQCLNRVGRKMLTVGISGVTCGGKSSIASLLKSTFPRAKFICQDDFYFSCGDSKSQKLDSVGHPNWDSLESIDMISMTRKVQEIIDDVSNEKLPTQNLLIIDGFLIFNYPPLAQLCDLKYFLTLPFEECLARRRKRTSYNIPDQPSYFSDVAWPMYLLHLKEMQKLSFANEIQYLDGTASLHENFERILKDIETYFDGVLKRF